MKVFPLVVAAAGAAFIFYQWMGGRPFWVDEQMIALNIRDRSLAALAGPLWFGQSAPLGWLALQRVASLMAGTSEQALRFIPALFGAATLGAAVWIGWRWMSALAALIFAVLCTFGMWLSFYPLEMKHYSSDALWGLLLPALAVWALDARDAPAVRRRALWWWAAAAVAHWLSNGGLFATPGCALLIAAVIWKRLGAREAVIFMAGGLAWLASFALYYYLSLSYTHHSPYLRLYWIAEFPPDGAGFTGTLAWLWDRLPALAEDPGGTSRSLALWVAAAAGFAFARTPLLGLAFATAPLTALLLAATGFVPLYGRFALWIVPALYAGVALLADRAVSLARAPAPGRLFRAVTTVAIAVIVLPPSSEIVRLGWEDFRTTRATLTNRGFDDRASTAWLLSQRRPGDAILTTRLGWPALWWYGAGPPAAGTSHFVVDHRSPGSSCNADGLRQALTPHTRAIVHIGFPDLPEGFGELLMRQLDQIGAIDKYREFSHLGFVAIVDLHTPGAEQSSLNLMPRRQPEPAPLEGCVTVKPAALW